MGKGYAFTAWLVLALLLLVGLPLHLCMPLWCDCQMFDVCARILPRGVVYREVYYFAPPGMLFAQTAVRELFGWRSEALRLADLLIVGAEVALLAGLVLPPPRQAGGRVWVACLFLFFYLGTTEFSHGQPDVWMLLPALAALA